MEPFTLAADGSLSVPLHVMHMPNGKLPVPNRTKELLIEIGTNAFDTWDTQVLPKRPDAFLVAFEPLVDKWSLMLTRNARARVVGQLGWHHARGVILPFAVSDRSGVVPFYVSPRDGCSSLRKTHRPERGGWRTNGFVRNSCAKTVQIRHVPAITLRTVLGEWLPGWRVAKLKIDAQGSDLGVLAAAGAGLLSRVDEISMEALSDDCDGLCTPTGSLQTPRAPPYPRAANLSHLAFARGRARLCLLFSSATSPRADEGQPNCSTIVREMGTLGFVPHGNFRCADPRQFTQGSGCEANARFDNKAVVGRPPVDEEAATWANPRAKGRGRGRGGRGAHRGV